MSEPGMFDQVIAPVTHDLGGFKVHRTLPSKPRTMVGPFLFFDQMGPAILGAGIDPLLLKELKILRTELAREQGVPPYVVFGDRTLQEMASQHPRTELEFSQLFGVGATKAKRYGPKFLELLNARE